MFLLGALGPDQVKVKLVKVEQSWVKLSKVEQSKAEQIN